MDIGLLLESVDLVEVVVGALCAKSAVSGILPHVKRVKANATGELIFDAIRAILKFVLARGKPNPK